jgi:hypothetical protein
MNFCQSPYRCFPKLAAIAEAAFNNDLADLADDPITMGFRANYGFIFFHTNPVHKFLCTDNSMESTSYKEYFSDLIFLMQFGNGVGKPKSYLFTALASS